MTAEIAVMNQEAVALAADSAVSGPKIFTSANKIFALSKYQPVGVMVNDSAQFVGVPWETIIKTYRAQLGQRSFRTLREQVAHFLGFFDRANSLFPPAEQETCNEFVFIAYFEAILQLVDQRLHERTVEEDALTPADITRVASEVVAEIHARWAKAERMPSLSNEHVKSITGTYREMIEGCIKQTFQKLPLSATVSRQLHWPDPR